jgi:hypothetical protein
VPDDVDYEWLAWLVEHPNEWSQDDLARARFMLTNQKRALQEAHAEDRTNRQSLQDVANALEAAIQEHLELPG